MKIILITLILLLSIAEAGDLKEKYKTYTEYLGMKTLDLNDNQLKEIIPKLEKKLSTDKSIKGILFQEKLKGSSRKIEQTICFSKEGQYLAKIGDNVTLQGGKCNGRTLPEMNKNGWKLNQIVGGLSGAFGMLLTKEY